MSNPIPGSAHVNLSFGGLVILGGIMGYMKQGSRISLAAGSVTGTLLLTSGYMIAKTDKVYEGHALATITSGILTVAMGQRYIMQPTVPKKFFPAGLTAILAAASSAYNFTKAREWVP
jgi:uncharacterized membrane protein (UPF0136 family)